jgi:hypothetical protein
MYNTITGEGFRTLGIYRAFFTAELARQRKIVDDYEAEVRDWYENGDGAAPDWRTDAECALCRAYFPHDTLVDGKCPEGKNGRHDLHFREVNYGGFGHTFPPASTARAAGRTTTTSAADARTG